MSLDELKEKGLLLPRDHWGRTPKVTFRSRLQILLCGSVFVASGLLVWFGRGGTWTFVGIGLFLADLLLFTYLTFLAVDAQVARLLGLGVGGQIEGLPEEGGDGVDVDFEQPDPDRA